MITWVKQWWMEAVTALGIALGPLPIWLSVELWRHERPVAAIALLSGSIIVGIALAYFVRPSSWLLQPPNNDRQS